MYSCDVSPGASRCNQRLAGLFVCCQVKIRVHCYEAQVCLISSKLLLTHLAFCVTAWVQRAFHALQLRHQTERHLLGEGLNNHCTMCFSRKDIRANTVGTAAACKPRCIGQASVVFGFRLTVSPCQLVFFPLGLQAIITCRGVEWMWWYWRPETGWEAESTP